MALGMIEVFGFATSIVVADAMAKAADVKVVAIDKNKPAAGALPQVCFVLFIPRPCQYDRAAECGPG